MRTGSTVTTMSTKWWSYVVKIAGDVPQEQIARKIDVATPTVNRWRERTPKPESVAAFARAYQRPVIEAFVAAGFMTAEEAGQQPATASDPGMLTDDELIREVERRIKTGGGGRGDEDQKMSGDADGSTGDKDSASPPLRTGRTVGRGPRIARDPAG